MWEVFLAVRDNGFITNTDIVTIVNARIGISAVKPAYNGHPRTDQGWPFRKVTVL